jgi:hypothetical protein
MIMNLYIPGNELVVLLVAARGAVVARVGDEGGHVQDLGEVDPGGDLLVQPARVLESITDGKMLEPVRYVPVLVVEKPAETQTSIRLAAS